MTLTDFIVLLVEYMTARKNLLDYANLFFPNYYKTSDKIIYRYFKDKYVKRWP